VAAVSAAGPPHAPARGLPPVLGRLLTGTFWLALRTPLQAVFAFWRVPLILEAIGEDLYGAFGFAWGFGFLQFLFEFGMSSALQRQVSERWTRGDREGVRRVLACGIGFYGLASLAQAAVLLGIAFFAVPDRFGPRGATLIVQLLWLQAVTAPCFGLSTVASSVLQAARRYDFMPRLELVIVVAQFAVLWFGLRGGMDFFLVCVIQTALNVGLSLVPAYWVMARELGGLPGLRGASWAEFRGLTTFSAYVALIQLSVVLADKIDTTVLGYALERPGPAISIYQAVSKPFLQLRQMGWMLAYLVMPAVASLAAAEDREGIEKIKYDGTRMLVGLLLPVVLLAAFDARPFLEAWVPKFAGQAWLMQLFLAATAPLVLSVLVQMATGMGRVRVIALAAMAGAAVNLPLSYAWTYVTGDVSGVIWGTVLTTLFSNLLVPGVYCFRTLDVRPGEFLRRSLGAPLAGAALLLPAAWLARGLVAPGAVAGASRLVRALPLLGHLSVGVAAYVAGYALAPSGRADLAGLGRKFRGRLGR
jgi:Na+-driven multidrug efflux pump